MATSKVNTTWQMYDKQQSPMLNEYSNNLLHTSTIAEKFILHKHKQELFIAMKLSIDDCKKNDSVLGLHFNCIPDLPTQSLFYEGC